ncbi:unnamed protein product [Oppiella nova]|uniref:guanylate kinase n=1 Tax=Oppiella nova TaxID=334625 RepID=A0A7R9MAV6_9ACAR|nr:unnamed protein product [Oppiella nova]CAG2173922.1 unnamed protein product [Oppiella nova]
MLWRTTALTCLGIRCRLSSHRSLMSSPQRLRPLVICGPSGSGKSTLLRKLMAEFDDCFGFCVSHTTRRPRAGEVDAKDYHFVDRQTFEAMVAENAFVEFTEFSGNFYGTSRQALDSVLKSSRIAVLDLDLKGVQSLRKANLDALYVWVRAPSLAVLERNLRGRETESEAALRERLSRAAEDSEFVANGSALFDAVIVNDVLDEAFARLKALLRSVRV